MPPQLKSFLQRWVITTLAVLVAAHVVSGIHYDRSNWVALLVASLLLGLLNAVVRPILMALSLPLLLVTLGLFTLFINAGLFYFVGRIVKGFYVDSFGAAFWGGLVISIVSILLNAITGAGNVKVQVRRGRPPKSSGGSGSSGPTIDI